jgi:AGCS family alanine or glycine:cation symporter
MIGELLALLEIIDNCLWGYLAVPGILILGSWLSIKSRFVQVRKFPAVLMTFIQFLKVKEKDHAGVHPLKAFFACIGGSTGISNIVAVCTAVQMGGPGALFWLWIAALAGMVVKYSEVYLGMRYRIIGKNGNYQGGPMFYLEKVFKTSLVPKIACVLLCIYGVEIYQFSIVANSITTLVPLNKQAIAVILIALVIGIGSGGVKRVGKLSSMLIPVFFCCYVSMGMWILCQNLSLLPEIFKNIFLSAFNGHAAVGAFTGSSIIFTMSQGIRRGCYSGDVGVGYASVIHSQTEETRPEKQASLAIFDIFLDSFIMCTTSLLLVMVTGVWKEPVEAALLIQIALGKYFPYMDIFMPIFLLLLGYTTIVAYFCAGQKCAEHLHPKTGKLYYYVYAATILYLFSFMETSNALLIMSLTGALLLMINLYGIFKLRHEIDFKTFSSADIECLEPAYEKEVVLDPLNLPCKEKIA